MYFILINMILIPIPDPRPDFTEFHLEKREFNILGLKQPPFLGYNMQESEKWESPGLFNRKKINRSRKNASTRSGTKKNSHY